MEQQRDIANKERERVINELVGLKKKLETIKVQRQKDAKDLSLMRHLKDKAVQVRAKHPMHTREQTSKHSMHTREQASKHCMHTREQESN